SATAVPSPAPAPPTTPPKSPNWSASARRLRTRASEEGPGDGAPVVAGLGEDAAGKQRLGALGDRADLQAGQVLGQVVAERAVDLLRQRAQFLDGVLWQALADPAPQHGAQLRLGVQADAVVHAVDPAVGAGQYVPGLAVGVVR